MENSLDLTTPFIEVPSGGDIPVNSDFEIVMSSKPDERSSTENSPSWLWDRLLPIAFFPLIAIQFLILVHYNKNLCPVPMLFSVGVFIFTATMYRQILSESRFGSWIVMALLPELSIFVTVTVATVTINALFAYQTLLVSTILIAVAAAWLTLLQIWQIYTNCCEDEDGSDEDEGNANHTKTTEYALVYDC